MNTLLFLKKKRLQSKVFFFALLLFAGASRTAWAQIYVAPTGNDATGDGTASAPYATMQKAHDVANAGATIYVGAGTYREQVNITKSNLTFQANGPVTIDGTDPLNGTWNSVGSGVYKTTAMNWDLYSPQDIIKNTQRGNNDQDPSHKGFGENQLFQDTTMIENLRWPHVTKFVNRDFISNKPENGFGIFESATVNDADKTTTFVDNEFTGGNLWVGARIFMNLARKGIDGQGWTEGKVMAISGTSITVNWYRGDQTLQLTPWGVGEGTEYFLFNPVNLTETNISTMLANGEWYKSGNTLYVKTIDGQAPNNSTSAQNIYAKRRHFAFAGNGIASGYTVDGFNLFACSATTSTAAETNTEAATSSCSGVTFKNLNIKYISHQILTADWQVGHNGWTGLVLNGNDHTVQNCIITYSATSAISLQGDRLKCLDNKIYQSNYMLSNSGSINFGRLAYSYDLNIGGNIISNTSLMGISMRNMRNSNPDIPGVARVHHNTIVNSLRRTGDSGAIDSFGLDMQWVRIDHNYIYNTLGHDELPEAAQLFGIYMDFGDSYTATNSGRMRVIIDHNVITNFFLPVILNGALDADVYNNVLIGNNRTDVSDNAKYSIANGGGQRSGVGVRIFNNIMSHPKSGNLYGGSLDDAIYINNIDDAKPRSATLSALFVNPVLTGTNRSFTDFALNNNSTTQTRAIDKGTSLGYFKAGVVAGNVPDLGAIEWGVDDGTSKDRTDPVGSGIITARGESLNSNPSGNMEKAFDNNPATYWSDTKRKSWIQFKFDDSEQYAVSKYTITSGNARSKKDLSGAASSPKNWTLYGTNVENGTFPGDYVAVDTRTNMIFDSKNSKQTFTINNTTEYRAYRLQITANNGARNIQVAEIELFSLPQTGVALTSTAKIL
ncbi:MAG TPA: hypothetical protein VGB63_11250, partial [Pedobacter sp.]